MNNEISITTKINHAQFLLQNLDKSFMISTKIYRNDDDLTNYLAAVNN